MPRPPLSTRRVKPTVAHPPGVVTMEVTLVIAEGSLLVAGPPIMLDAWWMAGVDPVADTVLTTGTLSDCCSRLEGTEELPAVETKMTLGEGDGVTVVF